MSYYGCISTLTDEFRITDGSGNPIVTFHFAMELASIHIILKQLENMYGETEFTTPLKLEAKLAGR